MLKQDFLVYFCFQSLSSRRFAKQHMEVISLSLVTISYSYICYHVLLFLLLLEIFKIGQKTTTFDN